MKNNIYAFIFKERHASGAEIVERFNISIEEARMYIMALLAEKKINKIKGRGDLDSDFSNCWFSLK